MRYSVSSDTFRQTPKAFACVALTVVLWAGAFPAIRAALASFGPAELASLRFTVASLALGIYLARIRPTMPSRSEFIRVIAAGGSGIAAYNLLLNTGSRTVDAGTASFVVNTAPVFTAVLGTAFLGERLRPIGWFGILMSFIGVALIATGRGDMGFGRGALLVLAAAVCQALQFVLQKPLLAKYSALAVTSCIIWAGTAILLPFFPGAIRSAALAPANTLFSVAFLGLGPAALAYVSWSYALSQLPVGRAATFLYLVPLLTTMLAWFWLAEVPKPIMFLGGAVALGGVVLVNTLGRATQSDT